MAGQEFGVWGDLQLDCDLYDWIEWHPLNTIYVHCGICIDEGICPKEAVDMVEAA